VAHRSRGPAVRIANRSRGSHSTHCHWRKTTNIKNTVTSVSKLIVSTSSRSKQYWVAFHGIALSAEPLNDQELAELRVTSLRTIYHHLSRWLVASLRPGKEIDQVLENGKWRDSKPRDEFLWLRFWRKTKAPLCYVEGGALNNGSRTRCQVSVWTRREITGEGPPRITNVKAGDKWWKRLRSVVLMIPGSRISACWERPPGKLRTITRRQSLAAAQTVWKH